MSSRTKIVEDFNKFLNIATDPLQLEPDTNAVAEICMIVDKLLVEPEDAIQAIHGKILDENPHTVDFALTVLNAVFYKCGNLVHSVIVTPDYMELIKDIIHSTEHIKIKEKIMIMLEDWADKFKYFPNYSAVQELLKELNSNDCKENGRNLKTEKLQDNNGNNPCTTCQNSVVNEKVIKVNNNCIKNDSNVCIDIGLDEREQEFKRQLRERQRLIEQKYKLHRKKLGSPSSDEEDIYMSDGENITAKKKELNACKIEGSESKKSMKLPKELQKQRNQRLQLNADVKEVRSAKHENFTKYNNNYTCEMRQCMGSNCENCESYKNKNRQEEHEVIPKRLPKEMKKVKESRQLLNDSVNNYRETKKEEYYNKKHSNNKLNSAEDSIDNNVAMKSYMSEEEFQKDLQKALLLSKKLSLEEPCPIDPPAMDPSKYDDDLQKAIDLSFKETEEQNFSPMPKLHEDDDDLQLQLAKVLSLEEMKQKQDKDTCKSKMGFCSICFETKPGIKRFLPCKHRSICQDCILGYPLSICPSCRQDYTEISD